MQNAVKIGTQRDTWRSVIEQRIELNKQGNKVDKRI